MSDNIFIQSAEQCQAAIRQALAAGQITEAAKKAAFIVSAYKHFAPGWYLLSRVSDASHNANLACKAALKSVALAPQNPDHLLQLARCYRRLGESTRAIAVAKKVAALANLDAMQWDLLGTIFFRLGEVEEAASCHQKAYALMPENSHIVFNMAAAYQTMGDLAQAETLFEQVIASNPNDVDAHASLSQLRKQRPDKHHIERLKAVIASCEPNSIALHKLYYALAKEYEDIGDSQNSFAFLQQGADIRRRLLDYDVQDDIAVFDAIIGETGAQFFSGLDQGCQNEEAIFIVGMPRSGTTLVEQIVSSHSDVFAAGELHNFGIAAQRVSGHAGSKRFISAEQLVAMRGINYQQLGEYYLQSTRPRTGESKKFIDKLPMNVQLCGHIHKALPKAKIILLDRDPVDVCYSNYKLSFKTGYEYSYHLQELGQYYLAYARLVKHWQKVLPKGSFYTVSYEALVANQELESKKLIEFCGLDWQQACLQFHKNQQGVATASSAQVRQPMYRSSVNRWKDYQQQLQPLIQTLREGGIAV